MPKGATYVPVHHGLGCGLRGRTAGKKGETKVSPFLSINPFPLGRAARARVSSAFQLPPSCVDRVSRTDATPEMARRGRRALRGGVATALLVAFQQLGGGNFAVTHLARAARPYLRQQMPQIFGQMPMYLLLPKGKGVIRKRGETSCLPCMRATAAQRRLLASRSAPAARSGPFPTPAGGEIPAREARAPKGPLGLPTPTGCPISACRAPSFPGSRG